MNEYAYIDIFLTVLGVLFVVRGFSRGFVKEVFTLGAPVLGVLGAVFFYKTGAEYIKANYIKDIQALPDIAAFIIIFLSIFILCKLFQKFFSDVIKGMKLDSMDKFLGAVFGIIEGIAAISLTLFVITVQPFFNPAEMLQDSLFGKILLPLLVTPIRDSLEMMPHIITGFFNGRYYPG